jgi:(E)-4-hydroxy-3-methylbut-2-enyl-diphosphate synthase
MIKKRRTREVSVGIIKIGAGNPVAIQSMAKTDTADVRATAQQIEALERCGCEIVRAAVKDITSAQALDKIKARINIPLIADIHFNYRLALEAIKRGVDGLRLNPGNIYRKNEVREVAIAAKKKRIPIRVGVNSGSLRNTKTADSMVKSALSYIKMLEGFGFYEIIVSLKASDVTTTVTAYRRMAKLCNYPFHLGITASGLPEDGKIKSAIGIGSLLLEGIGDTIRVSLTAEPIEEVKAAKRILQALDLRTFGPQIISCPTCGRTHADLVKIVREVKRKLNCKPYTVNGKPSVKLAIMGCEVNGPGEASDADLGLACGKDSAALFKKGKIIKRVKQNQIADTLIQELIKWR